jgi:hypothetical protein
MRTRIKPADALPQDLAQSAPRQVTLSRMGMAVAVAMASLVIGAMAAAIGLYQRLSHDADPVAVTQARILRVQPRGDRVVVNYSYSAGGRQYGGSTRVRKREASRLPVDSTVSVQYAVSRPQESWLANYGRRPMPFWIAMAVPGALLLCIVPVVITVRRQARLLREGRVALARITNRRKRNLGDYSSWRVAYEWTLLSGAVRSGRHDSAKNPPPVGTLIPILYDRENPKRHAPYPLPLVRLCR